MLVLTNRNLEWVGTLCVWTTAGLIIIMKNQEELHGIYKIHFEHINCFHFYIIFWMYCNDNIITIDFNEKKKNIFEKVYI